MSRKNILRLLTLATTLAALFATPSLHAQTDGTWVGSGGNSIWGGFANWTPGGQIATGAGATAFFADSFGNGRTILLNTNRTLGHVVYTDPGLETAMAISWFVNQPGVVLTLSAPGDKPSFNVTQADRTLTVTARLGGSNGFTKTGPGTMVLAAPGSTPSHQLTGTIVIEEGVLRIDGSDASGVLGLNDNSNTSIASGATLRINRTGTAGNAMVYGGSLSGTGTVEILSGARMDFIVNQLDSGNLSFVVDGTLASRTVNGVNTVHLGELSGSGNVQRGAGTTAATTTLVIGGKNTDSTFSGRIFTNEMGVEKVGTGKLTLTGVNDYGRSTLVSGGTLIVNGEITNTSSVTVAAGGTLSGSGTITTTANSTTIETGATLAPGDASMSTGTGTLSLNTSSLTFDPGSFWAVNIAGADNGRLQLNSPAVSLDLSEVSLVAGSTSFSPLTDTPYWILDNEGQTALTGMFANMTLDGVGANMFAETPTGYVDLGGTPFAVFLNADFGSNGLSGGNDIVLFAIPEPSHAMLMALALGALVLRRRR